MHAVPIGSNSPNPGSKEETLPEGYVRTPFGPARKVEEGLYVTLDGRWYAKLRIQGVRYVRSLHTKVEAVARQQLLVFIADPAGWDNRFEANRRATKPTTDAVDEYLDLSKRVKKNVQRHVDRQRTVLAILTAPDLPTQLARLTPQIVEQVFALRAEMIGATTAYTDLVMIKGFFKWCVAKKYLKESPAAGIAGPRRELNVTDRRRVIPAEVIEAMTFEGVEDAALFRAMLVSLWGTGVRISELLRIAVTCIHQRDMELFISKSKGRQSRLVPIADEVIRDALLVVATAREGGLIPRPAEKRFSQALDREVCRLGCERFTPHALRHSRASLWVNDQRISPLSVKEWMGHSSLEITMLYFHAPQGARPPASGLTRRLDEALR
jgi:integrase/recombinase XerD